MNNKFLLMSALVAILFFTACSDDDPVTPMIDFGTAPTASIIESGTVEVITEDEVRYHVLIFGELVTSVIVETEEGVTLIDVAFSFQNIANSGVELRTYVDAIGKPISVIITHDHRDHFGNMDQFADATVYAETHSAEELLADPIFTDLYSGPVIPVSGSQEIAGLNFVFNNISNAEGAENGFITIPSLKALFAGDLVFNRSHAFVREYTPLDNTDEVSLWTAGLNEMKSNQGNYNHIFMGHNGQRTDVTTAIDENIAYLADVRGLIKGTTELSAGGFATTVEEVVDELMALYPDYKPGGLFLALPDGFFPGDPGANWFE